MSRIVPYLGHGSGATRSGALFRAAAGAAAINAGAAIFNRATNAAGNYLYSAGANAVQNAPSYLRRAYNSYRASTRRMPRVGRAMRYRRRGRRTFGRRRRFSSRRFVRKPRWTGRRFNKRAFRKGLDTNFARNDRDSVRSMTFVDTLTVNDAITIVNNSTYRVNGNLVKANFADQFDKYDEFKMSKIQFVIQPRVCGNSNGNYIVGVANLPYLLVREGDPARGNTNTLNYNDALQTPGYRFVHIMKKKRSVFNVTPGMKIEETVMSDAAAVKVLRHKHVGWLKTDTVGVDFDQASLEILRPPLNLGTDDLIYDIYCYITCNFRGNKIDLVDP